MLLEILGIVFVLVGVIILLFASIAAKYNHNYPKVKREKLENFCILIPARYESTVIEDLLISIENQTKKINMKDVFIIIESDNDPTSEIAKKHGATIFIRKKLDLKRKGYALEEVIEDLVKKNKFYDAYFIIDADNVLDSHFLEEMEKTYQEGYDIGMGYRNLKNGDDSIISACSGITFSFINSNGNDKKSKQSRNITLSGTGLYISGELIKNWKTFPFHSLTEDYELTLYSILNNLTSYYNENAIFYDEQPIKYKNTINQRIRWIKGYFSNRMNYLPLFRKKLKNNPNIGSIIGEASGMKPYIFIIIGAVLYLLNQIFILFKVHDFKNAIMHVAIFKIFAVILLAYLIFACLSFFTIYKDKGKLKLSNKMKIKTILFSPLFFVTYVPCALKAIFTKNVSWDRVDHTRKWEK